LRAKGRSVRWAAFFTRQSVRFNPACKTQYRGLGASGMDAGLRAFIDRLSFPTRVVVVTFVVVVTLAVLFDFEISSSEISRLLTWRE
jgi:hypothetical protein